MTSQNAGVDAICQTTMNTLSDFLIEEHERCDHLYIEAENAVAGGDWPQAEQHFGAFLKATLRHFGHEESVLFPAFEMRTGMTAGPTVVMRAEHAQMREALKAMQDALAAHNRQDYLGLAETLLYLMRQHNMKEEQILYPMSESALGDESAALMERMVAMHD